MSCPACEILLEIRDLLRDLDTLKAQREKARIRMAAKRAALKDVREQKIVREHKEDGKGKETFPPAPPIEKGEREKKEKKTSRAHVRFVPPTQDAVAAYCRERRNSVDPVLWWNFYASKGWLVGKAKMVDWKRAVITWERTGAKAERTDPKVAAFERQRAEAEARTRSAAAFASKLIDRRNAELEGGCHD